MSIDASNIIIGGGHSGCNIANDLASNDEDYLMFELTPNLGGIWRHKFYYKTEKDPLDNLKLNSNNVYTNATVQSIRRKKNNTKSVLIEYKNKMFEARSQNIHVATGSHEEPIIFPGWTLPKVITEQAAEFMFYRDRVEFSNEIIYLTNFEEKSDFINHLSGQYSPSVIFSSNIWKFHCYGSKEAEGVVYKDKKNNINKKTMDLLICKSKRLPNTELLESLGTEIENKDGLIRLILYSGNETSIPGVYVYGSAMGVEE